MKGGLVAGAAAGDPNLPTYRSTLPGAPPT